MVAAGEQSGALDIVLNRLTDYTENPSSSGQGHLRLDVPDADGRRVRPHRRRPLRRCHLGIRRIFDSFGAGLPPLTRLVLGVSDFIQGYCGW